MVMLAEADQAERVVEQMVAVENHLAELYETYSRCFPAHSEFWSALAGEERVHARWVCELYENVSAGQLGFEPEIAELPALEAILAHVEEKTAQARNQDIALAQALSTAADMEHMVIEKNMFDAFTGESPHICDLRHAAIQETRDHFRRILALWHVARGEK